MKVRIEINGTTIETLDISRLQALEENEDDREYTYVVRYARKRGHRTFKGQGTAAVRIKHNFSKGSLALVEKAVAAIRKEVS